MTMAHENLDNLVRMGRLMAHTPTPDEVRKLVSGAERCLRDAESTSISSAARFTLAYTAIMESAQAALFANGYRPSKSEGGHHMTMVQALVITIGLDSKRMQVLDTFRRKRNVIDYSGEDADPTEVRDVIAAARRLLSDVKEWIGRHRADLA